MTDLNPRKLRTGGKGGHGSYSLQLKSGLNFMD
jgi:hypothetical protein